MKKTYKCIPFDVELAKKIQSGEIDGRIVTRNNIDVTILCFDRKSVCSAPIVALVHYNTYDDHVNMYSETGYLIGSEKRDYDLFIELPEKTPKCDDVEEVLTGDGSIVFLRHNKREFKPFDKVLVRNKDTEQWFPAIYTHIHNDVSGEFYALVGNQYATQCIPYAGNEHLVGTTNKPE